MSSPSVAAALALAEIDAGLRTRPDHRGRDRQRDLLPCRQRRAGAVSSGAASIRRDSSRRSASRISPAGCSDSTPRPLARAAGICGSFASGLLECWVDGTQTEVSASRLVGAERDHGGVSRARRRRRARRRCSRGAAACSRRTCRTRTARRDFEPYHRRPRHALGQPQRVVQAVSRGARASIRTSTRCCGRGSTRARRPPTSRTSTVRSRPSSCRSCASHSPRSSRRRSDSHGRVSLQYTLAEACTAANSASTRTARRACANPEILALARRVRYHVDPDFPGPGRFKGAVHVTLKDGRDASTRSRNTIAARPRTR